MACGRPRIRPVSRSSRPRALPGRLPLGAIQLGLGYRRNNPSFRRLLGISQAILEPADPVNWVRHYSEPLDIRAEGPRRTKVLYTVTMGERMVSSSPDFGDHSGEPESFTPRDSPTRTTNTRLRVAGGSAVRHHVVERTGSVDPAAGYRGADPPGTPGLTAGPGSAADPRERRRSPGRGARQRSGVSRRLPGSGPRNRRLLQRDREGGAKRRRAPRRAGGGARRGNAEDTTGSWGVTRPSARA